MRTLLTLCLLGAAWALDWKQASQSQFPGRHGAAAVSFNGAIYLSGGRKDFAFHSDVYRSADGGFSWELLTAKAPFRRRAYHAMVVFDGALWVIGGQSMFDFFHDVWRSADGVDWELVSEENRWERRSGLSAVVFQEKIVISGGSAGFLKRKFYSDVWSSVDGKTWDLVGDEQWPPRFEPRMTVLKDKVFVLGGDRGFKEEAQFGDVWVSENLQDWKMLIGDAPWKNRSAHGVVAHKDKLYVLGGYYNQYDMWETKDGKQWSLVDKHLWNCDSVECGRYDFTAVVHRMQDGTDALVLIGGCGSKTSFGNVYNDTWITTLSENKSKWGFL